MDLVVPVCYLRKQDNMFADEDASVSTSCNKNVRQPSHSALSERFFSCCVEQFDFA